MGDAAKPAPAAVRAGSEALAAVAPMDLPVSTTCGRLQSRINRALTPGPEILNLGLGK